MERLAQHVDAPRDRLAVADAVYRVAAEQDAELDGTRAAQRWDLGLPLLQSVKDKFMNKESTTNRTPRGQTPATVTQRVPSTYATHRTNHLLTAGVLAGPVYITVGVVEMLTRPGFDLRRHALSLLSNGDWGWIHSSMLVTTGLLTMAGAAGIRRQLRGDRGGTWGPLLLGVYGLGVLGAGIFPADPAFGFPPGTPGNAPTGSWRGALHLITGSIGFLGLIAATFVFARRFAAHKQPGWAAYSVVTGVLFLAAFVGIATGSQQQGARLTVVNLAFSVAVVLGWAWVTALAARLRWSSRGFGTSGASAHRLARTSTEHGDDHPDRVSTLSRRW